MSAACQPQLRELAQQSSWASQTNSPDQHESQRDRERHCAFLSSSAQGSRARQTAAGGARQAGNMWDDEDNNPYGSFERRDSETSDIQSPTDRA